MTAAEEDEQRAGLSLPRWFLVLGGVIMPGAIAWAAWVSMQLVRLDIKLENVSSIGDRVSRIEGTIQSHFSDPSIHHAMLARLSDRIELGAKERAAIRETVSKLQAQLNGKQ